MGLRDIVRAIREYPTAQAELETVRTELLYTKQALEQSEQDCESLSLELLEEKDHTDFFARKTEALQDALEEFCPRLSTPEEMKRFYDAISPSMDAHGLTLYRMAKELTGIDVPTCFPYEDNRGLFEAMEGYQLLNWLTAVHFQAVDWEIIPGTPYERADLREVDTTTPEYKAFEKKLYEKVLERMGFEGILAPEAPQSMELKLYSPLSAELVEDAPARDWIDESETPDSQILDGEDLTAPVFHTAILKGIEAEQAPEEAERGLMLYYHGSESVKDKVSSLRRPSGN